MIYIHICIHTCVYVYLYIYVHIYEKKKKNESGIPDADVCDERSPKGIKHFHVASCFSCRFSTFCFPNYKKISITDQSIKNPSNPIYISISVLLASQRFFFVTFVIYIYVSILHMNFFL